MITPESTKKSFFFCEIYRGRTGKDDWLLTSRCFISVIFNFILPGSPIWDPATLSQRKSGQASSRTKSQHDVQKTYNKAKKPRLKHTKFTTSTHVACLCGYLLCVCADLFIFSGKHTQLFPLCNPSYVSLSRLRMRAYRCTRPCGATGNAANTSGGSSPGPFVPSTP